MAILRDERVHEDDGRYNFDVEAENGIRASESGSPDGPEGTIVSAGEYSYTAPDGTDVVVKYVANENGFQPQSDLLPVAPEFPHPIPQFVLDQIASPLRRTPVVVGKDPLRGAALFELPPPPTRDLPNPYDWIFIQESVNDVVQYLFPLFIK
ncbi:cuticle protein AMP1A-like isoform X2 [Macrobrachium nipponense]|uniref:cuticle protein AMP1A-like isoform X2 n=1 Tax=Macrobrachium nipponense TaxID=159736 RepID=UPI0030C877EB